MRNLYVLLVAGAVVCGAGGCGQEKSGPAGEGASAPAVEVPFFGGLGSHVRAVSGASAESQRHGIPPDWLRTNALFADGFPGMPYEVC